MFIFWYPYFILFFAASNATVDELFKIYQLLFVTCSAVVPFVPLYVLDLPFAGVLLVNFQLYQITVLGGIYRDMSYSNLDIFDYVLVRSKNKLAY